MESLEYNYFPAGPNQYQYLDYSAAGSDVTATSVLENPLDSNTFLPGPFDYGSFDASTLGSGTGLTPIPMSTSPSTQFMSLLTAEKSTDSALSLDMDDGPSGRRSSSEEKEAMTPAQSRRKAQNRAAQRAFRERKERHVRDLEAKLNLLTSTTSSLQSDNERLKLMLQRAQTENEILRATSSTSPSTNHPPGFVDDPTLLQSSRQRQTRNSRSSGTRPDPATRSGLPSSTISSSPDKTNSSEVGQRHLLSASATWDLLQSHPLYLAGAVDIGEVCERLKKLARCEGMGPVFDESEVRKVIEEVGKSGGEELI